MCNEQIWEILVKVLNDSLFAGKQIWSLGGKLTATDDWLSNSLHLNGLPSVEDFRK